MKVETPQILWHAEAKNLPAALLSIDVHGEIMATAGNGIHLWKQQQPSNHHNHQHPGTAPSPRYEFITALNRHDGPVNRIAFNANHYLASAGDTGDVIIFHQAHWDRVVHENDVRYVNAGRAGEAVTDLAWSGDSNRLVVCTIDHTVAVIEQVVDKQNQQQNEESSSSSSNTTFRIVFRSSDWHSHYVQGVTYDPLNLYICTASSDRTVRVAQARTVKKQFHMAKARQVKGRFVDEGSLKSFCRRLAWTPDGGYLIVPAAANAVEDDSYATLLYARHRFDEPARILGGLDKPSICVRPNPVLFKVPDDSKENGSQHRCIFCVLTWDSVIIYDTHHDHPLSIITGIHYSNLVDAAWTADGMKLCVCSTDGFITFMEFADGELGEPLPMLPVKKENICDNSEVESTRLAALKIHHHHSNYTTTNSNSKSSMMAPCAATTAVTLPPCEPGLMMVHAPPTKRAKLETSKRSAMENLDEANAVKKKKKRVQPVLVGTTTG